MSERVHRAAPVEPYISGNHCDRGIDIASYGYTFERRGPKSRSEEYVRRARRSEQRSRALLAVLAAVVIGLVGFILGLKLSEKITAAGSAEPVSYESVLIEEGDTLETIAKSKRGANALGLKTYEKEIAEINGINKNLIHAGNYLVVPVYE